ncbi:MAG: hypothetical protein HY717_12570 [Planctomycetes bacterium]|nr:hypothetical protein [Planctomycetota bacterium]
MDSNLKQVEIYRAMSPSQRIQAACDLHDFAQERLIVHLKTLHPEKTDEEILVEAAKRFLNESAGVLRKSPGCAKSS